jgi:hypothetical protein
VSASGFVRATHRTVSVAFTLAVTAYAVVMSFGTPPGWMGGLAFGTLLSMWLSGIWLFVLPYLRRRPAAAPGGP